MATEADFSEATFSNEADFNTAKFFNEADFVQATFYNQLVLMLVLKFLLDLVLNPYCNELDYRDEMSFGS